ncbi:hypothetical protein K492DRAFT_68285 [Lichtheimia hyalospora FSU 10163]|nr:hypothetical protein K492DRAFT_68285 [Lichtheimia hyalospora FSU 10163]
MIKQGTSKEINARARHSSQGCSPQVLDCAPSLGVILEHIHDNMLSGVMPSWQLCHVLATVSCTSKHILIQRHGVTARASVFDCQPIYQARCFKYAMSTRLFTLIAGYSEAAQHDPKWKMESCFDNGIDVATAYQKVASQESLFSVRIETSVARMGTWGSGVCQF